MITKRENSESRAELVRAMPSRERGRVILKDSIETAYSFLHQKRNVYIHSNLDWQNVGDYIHDDFRHELALYVDGLLFTGCAHSGLDNGRIKVLKVDVDKNQALAAAARIQSIPTLFFITKEGDIERVVGGLPYQELVRMAEKISSSEE